MTECVDFGKSGPLAIFFSSLKCYLVEHLVGFDKTYGIALKVMESVISPKSSVLSWVGQLLVL